MPQDAPMASGELDSITGHVSDGSTMTGAQQGKGMTLGEYKALQEQVVGVGERDVHLGLLLTDLVVRIAHLSGLDPEKELADEEAERERRLEKQDKEIAHVEARIEHDRAKEGHASPKDMHKLEVAERKEARSSIAPAPHNNDKKKGQA